MKTQGHENKILQKTVHHILTRLGMLASQTTISWLWLWFFSDLYHKPEKNSGDKLKKKIKCTEKEFRCTGTEFFIRFETDLDFQKSRCGINSCMLFLSCLILFGSRKILLANHLNMRRFWIDLELWKNVKSKWNRKTIQIKTLTKNLLDDKLGPENLPKVKKSYTLSFSNSNNCFSYVNGWDLNWRKVSWIFSGNLLLFSFTL